MSNCKRLEKSSLADTFLEKFNKKQICTISVKTKFGKDRKNIIYFDFNLKTVSINEYQPNYIGQPVLRHQTSKYDQIRMEVDNNNNIIIYIALIPENPKETETTLSRIIYYAGFVEDVV